MKTKFTLSFCLSAVLWAQTQIDLSTQAKKVDFTGATYTRPVKTGLMPPAQCTVGDLFFQTSGSAGLYGCISANEWAAQGSGGASASVTVLGSGSAVGARSTLNFVPAGGILTALSDNGQAISIQTSVDTSSILSRSTDQAGTDKFCQSTGQNVSVYSCHLQPTLTAYSAGMVVDWQPDVTCAAGGVSLNVDTLGSRPIALSDGISSPGPSNCPAEGVVPLTYDGTLFRIAGGSSGGGPTASANGFYLQIGNVNYILPWLSPATLFSSAGFSFITGSGEGSGGFSTVGHAGEILAASGTVYYDHALGGAHTITAAVYCTTAYGNGSGCGPYLRESSTQKVAAFAVVTNGNYGGTSVPPAAWYGVNYFNSWTAYNATKAAADLAGAGPFYFRIDIGTNTITYSVSSNGGNTWTQVYSSPLTELFSVAPDGYGFTCGANNNSGCSIDVLHLSVQ